MQGHCGTVFACPLQSPYSGTTWYSGFFPLSRLLSRVLHVTLANLQRFGSEFHLHLVDDQSIQPITSLLAIPCWRDPTRSTVTIFGFQFGLYHALVTLSFPRTIILASLFSSHHSAHPDEHQYGVSIQISINVGKNISEDRAFTFFLFPDSGLYLLSGFGFYFDRFWMTWHCHQQ